MRRQSFHPLRRVVLACVFFLACTFAFAPAKGSPWAEVGDDQLRSDIEVLAAAGVIDDITTHWPLPWAGILARLDGGAAVVGQPDYVREAAERVLATARRELHTDHLALSASADATNDPDVVRGFDGLGRETFQTQVSGEYQTGDTAIRINAGAQIDHKNGHTEFMPDGSYVAGTMDGVLAYAGWVTHWWGPGWISALSLSNNARPMPQIGIERLDTAPFKSPWLSWIGPWQLEFFVGWLDDSRIATNTILDGLKWTFNPLPGLEIGVARTDELCGKGHPCEPFSTYFTFANTPAHPSKTNDEGDIDVRYTNIVFGVPLSVYSQAMNEDSNPIVHSATSHLFGGTVWLPVGRTRMRVTVEYTSSLPTQNIFGFGEYLYGAAYHDYKYVDGMRYRGRTIGFSLDSDSRLATLQASWIGPDDIVYTLTYDHAWIGSPNSTATNIVTTAPVEINLGEVRISLPYRGLAFVLAGRVQDDQPRPDKGFTAAIEGGVNAPI